MPSTVIVGLGVSGLACALELTRNGVAFTAFEKERRPGGLARTQAADGFRFDYGPHVLLDVPAELAAVFETLPGLDLVVCSGQSAVAVGDGLKHLVPVPFQRNLNWLPLHERLRVLRDLTLGRRAPQPATYRDYVAARCGRRVAELFLGDYETKRLRFDLDAIPADWTKRVEAPSLRSLLEPRRARGASRGGRTESRFQYPRSGGIEALPRAIAAMLPETSLCCGNPLVEIDLQARQAVFAQGPPVRYDRLVLSLPLIETVRLVKDAPDAVRRAAANLVYASVYVVSFGVEGPVPPWTFLRFPSPDLPFHRMSFPASYAADVAPPGAGIVMTEIGHHPVRHPVSPAQALAQCRDGLRRAGVIGQAQKIVIERIEDIRYAHVIYNRETETSIRFILGYLQDHGVLACGKYGTWKDMLMTHSMLSGIDAARAIVAARHA